MWKVCWSKGRLYWKIAKLFNFCHLSKLARPETYGPYTYVCVLLAYYYPYLCACVFQLLSACQVSPPEPCTHFCCLPYMPHGMKCGSFEYPSTVYVVPFTGYADADVYTSRVLDSRNPTLCRTTNRLWNAIVNYFLRCKMSLVSYNSIASWYYSNVRPKAGINIKRCTNLFS